ncbi:MAG: GNAT family N-acetyltransferase [Lachnospiraceae bacterium]|nr:GNAT family N-acetyltransferase [Lachnospiraceae bacterium]MBQ8634443.1 GNAT family N-acetyltransferase [Lachnospiraceae bacterium]
MNNIRQATPKDIARIAEIEIFNYRLNFYPIFQNDWFYFDEKQVPKEMKRYATEEGLLRNTFVYDDGVVKGFIQLDGSKVAKLFVEPVLQGNGIGAKLLEFAVTEKQANYLWALEKNVRAIRFYERHGFHVTTEKELEEGTTEYLVRLERR